MLIVTVFGASGDLAHRKTFPALFALFAQDRMPTDFAIVGYARSDMADNAAFADKLKPSLVKMAASLSTNESIIDDFLKHCSYVRGAYDNADDFVRLKQHIDDLECLSICEPCGKRVCLNNHSLSEEKTTSSNSNGNEDVIKRQSSPNFNPEIVDLQRSASSLSLRNQLCHKARLYYLALPPSVFSTVAFQIRHVLVGSSVSSKEELLQHRIVVEKPFGRDSDSSSVLSAALARLFPESSIYRIDHYLGKEMVKSIGTLRFGNRIFQAIWCAEHISTVQIVFKETIGVEGRGAYFDEYGIIRDVMQNHLLQMLSVIAMERPLDSSADAIRDQKVALLKDIAPVTKDNIIIGQYVARKKKVDGEEVESVNSESLAASMVGYRQDPTVPDHSNTPTFAMAVLYIDNDRWRGVPFILRCGKGLVEQKAEVRVQFKGVPDSEQLFPSCAGALNPNELVIRVQPQESVYLKLNVKRPGHHSGQFSVGNESYASDRKNESDSNAAGLESTPLHCASSSVGVPMLTDLDLSYARRYCDLRIPDAYESLLNDALRGDQSNFVRADELQEAWRIFTPILHELETVEPIPYEVGTRGPTEADEMLRRLGYIPRPVNCSYTWPVQSL